MRTSQALREIAEVTAEQWGLITAAQAQSVGIGRMQLSRLADSGHLKHVLHGVYKDAGSPIDNFETIKANWLAANPSKFAYERITAKVPDFVASGITATHLFEIGDFEPSYVQFTTAKRKQTQRNGIVFKTQVLKPENITYEQGLPVTRIEQTVTDLIAEHQDFSHVAQILAEANKIRIIDNKLLSTNFMDQLKKISDSQKTAIQTLDKLKDYAGLSEVAKLSTAISSGSMKNMLDQITKVAEMKIAGAATSKELASLVAMSEAANQLAASIETSDFFKSIAKTQAEFKKLAELSKV